MRYPFAMILRLVVCVIICATTISGYSVSEEESELDDPAPTVVPSTASTLNQDKPVATGKQNKSIRPDSETDPSNPYNDEIPLKAVKYKNYGYFNPSVATIKISKQLAAAKPDAFAGQAVPAAGPAGVQFKQNRNVQAQILGFDGTSAAVGPKFHFQRRLGESEQSEVEEEGDSVNVRDLNRKTKPTDYTSGRSSEPLYSRKTDRSKYITIIDSPRATLNIEDVKPFTSSKRKSVPRVLSARVGGSRRSYERNLKSDTISAEKDDFERGPDKPESVSEKSKSSTGKKNVEVDSLAEKDDADVEKEMVGQNAFGTKSDKKETKELEVTADKPEETFSSRQQSVKLKSHWKAPVQYPALAFLRKRPGSVDSGNDRNAENESEKRRRIIDEEDEENHDDSFGENVAENDASASSHHEVPGEDVAEFDRQYRRLSRVRPFSARGHRRLQKRSLDDNLEHRNNRENDDITMDPFEPPSYHPEEMENTGFIPTPLPGMVYLNESSQNDTKDTDPKTKEGPTGPPSVFLPTRPPGAEEDNIYVVDDTHKESSANKTEGHEGGSGNLSTYYSEDVNGTKASSGSTMIFVTAPTPEITIEDFINAFANATEHTNRHRDPTENDATIPLHKSAVESVNSSASNHFLALEPHFSSSSSPLDLESPREIKYPCTCDNGKCGCCTGRLLSNFNLNLPSRGCLNITYIPEDFEFNVKMTYNDRTLVQRRVSGKNPRPMCVPLPRISGRAQACVKMSNVYLVGRNVHLCLDLEARVQNEELFKVSFDCIRMGTNGIKWIKPEDGGGLGPPPVVEGPTPDDYDAIVAAEGDEITSAKRSDKKKPGANKEKINKKKKEKEDGEKEDEEEDDEDDLF
uniref:DUF4773 domain-containing protein n=1 Tax=Cacopsylla melanoneura TaxID=428564 RepID=A0A8D9BPI9_9HEMI